MRTGARVTGLCQVSGDLARQYALTLQCVRDARIRLVFTRQGTGTHGKGRTMSRGTVFLAGFVANTIPAVLIVALVVALCA